jgi:hypothetical protein
MNKLRIFTKISLNLCHQWLRSPSYVLNILLSIVPTWWPCERMRLYIIYVKFWKLCTGMYVKFAHMFWTLKVFPEIVASYGAIERATASTTQKNCCYGYCGSVRKLLLKRWQKTQKEEKVLLDRSDVGGLLSCPAETPNPITLNYVHKFRHNFSAAQK